MLGFNYIKVSPTTFVMNVKNGIVTKEGTGLSFVYFAPSSTILSIPIGSTDLPFIFNETTADFQAVTVQGHLTFRVQDPKALARLLDYSWRFGAYQTDDPKKLALRVTQAAQNAVRAEVQALPLRSVLTSVESIGPRAFAALTKVSVLEALGLEIIGFSILAIKPAPETSRALEAEARERLLREADDAIYSRRNNAVEQERKIKENELNTEVAVTTKQHEIEQTRLSGQIAIEQQRRELVTSEAENTRTSADAQAYTTEATLKPFRDIDPKILQALAITRTDPRAMVAMAFQELAANAGKIANLSISPELLDSLITSKKR